MVDSNAIGSKYTRKSSEILEKSSQMNPDFFLNNEQQREMNFIQFGNNNDAKHHLTSEHSVTISKKAQIEALRSQFQTNQILCKLFFYCYSINKNKKKRSSKRTNLLNLRAFLF